MTSTVHATGRASPFVLTYVAEILQQSESLELKICAIHLHSSLRAMNGVFSRGTDKNRRCPNSPKGHSMTSPREGEIARAGWWSRLDTCQDCFFSVSQQDIDRLKASIREQTYPLHHGQPVPDAILIVGIAEEAIIVAQ